MESAYNNPPKNILGPGISDDQVTTAIKESGYPLQLQIANMLKQYFFLQEEWAFPDSDTQSTRTIDILASQLLFEWKEPQPRVRPSLNFVIECKQSDLPYVFFLSETQLTLPDFPLIAGLKNKHIVITSDDDPSHFSLDPLYVLGLNDNPFLTSEAPICLTLSKCVRKGSSLALSGSDAYQGLVFPLTKAAQHLQIRQTPPETAHYFDCDLIIPLAVVDAPMVGVSLDENGAKSELLPWVRVARHQPMEGKHSSDRGTVLGIDVVHKDFLMTYINEHAMPFAKTFAQKALKHHHELADGRGFISGLNVDSWTNLEERLQKASIASANKRGKAIIKNILLTLAGKSNR